MGDNNEVKENQPKDGNSMQILEEALLLGKFGKFHVRLMIATLAAVLASTAVTTTASYILPNAECDLNMTIMQKGLLNAMPFFGQVGACIFTGFLIDAFGRKIFLVGGNIGMFVCAVLNGSSQSYWMLLFGKLFEGIFVSISFGATASMVTEFIHKKVRDRVMMVHASFMSISLVIMALLSWGLLIQPWDVVLWKGCFELHAWNFYFYVCSAFSLIAGISYYYLPESPKFLLSHGQENKALEILKDIYSINTGQDRDTFPIKSLNVTGEYVPTDKYSIKKQLVNALYEVKTLFRRPFLFHLIQFSLQTAVCLLAYTSLRLWFPQLSTIVENYQLAHNETQQFCVMLDEYTEGLSKTAVMKSNITGSDICIPQLSGSDTYINGVIMGVLSLFCISINGYLVSIVGQKPLMFIMLLLCAACSGSLYWTYTSLQIAILISATCGLMQTVLSLQQSILVRVFPTTLRTLTISLILMAGRTGSLLGNVVFPIMLQAGCMVPFLTMSAITVCVSGLVYFLPNPQKNNNAGDQ
ncbi:synaptic vesicle glycoprotein 2B [Amyelois transitella]|uniref:synaptic vesicle glycoprotein 2B n=1 Tax=Amyelois transitella TaxID=680683 RepID=UPI00067A96F0|nr:synaptic vesicle glycoprotein 2B [Amyelois transitella]